MNRFVRFIFFLVAIGAVVNLTIVVGANYATERTQRRLLAEERQNLRAHYNRLRENPTEAHFAVEWQKLGERNKVIETSVLVRLYGLDANKKPIPIPVQRCIFPGDRITVDGLDIDFLENFAAEFDFLRGANVRFLTGAYTEDQPKKLRPRLYIPWDVPVSVAMNPEQPTQIERRVWQIAGEAANYSLNTPTIVAHQRDGVRATRLASDSVTLANGGLYRVVATETGIGISPTSDDATLRSMRQEAAKLDAQQQP